LIAQGFYLAPHVVSESLKGAVFAAGLFAAAGYKTYPGIDDKRGDIVQTLEFGNAESLVHFCQSVQQASPVDSFVSPEPWAMTGYDSDVIMAAGALSRCVDRAISRWPFETTLSCLHARWTLFRER
jgi:cystathionine beta-lyase family protein involved in aluminum resistance